MSIQDKIRELQEATDKKIKELQNKQRKLDEYKKQHERIVRRLKTQIKAYEIFIRTIDAEKILNKAQLKADGGIESTDKTLCTLLAEVNSDLQEQSESPVEPQSENSAHTETVVDETKQTVLEENSDQAELVNNDKEEALNTITSNSINSEFFDDEPQYN